MIRVWRLCKEKYADTAFSGEGAKRVGGRWNSPGLAAAYTSENLSLAALELLVHLELRDRPPDMVAVSAEIPDELDRRRIEADELPETWRSVAGHPELRTRGDDWIEQGDEPVLVVPSVVIPQERNLVLNPDAPGFDQIETGVPEPFEFDDRLLP